MFIATVREVHKLLRPTLSHAVKNGYIDSNPAIHVELPKEEKFEREQWAEDELATLSSVRTHSSDRWTCLQITDWSFDSRTEPLHIA